MIRTLLLVGLVTLSQAAAVHAQPKTADLLRTNPKFLHGFRESMQRASASIARVQCDGQDTAIGVVISADGWILTKAHDLVGKVRCKLKDGRELEASLIGVHEEHDLAMLKVNALQLRPIEWSHSNVVRSGDWVASVGLVADPVAVGVVSVPTRKVQEAYLGVQVEGSPKGLVVLQIVQNSAALKAGLRHKDLIVRVNGQSHTDPESFLQFLAGHKPGDTITLSIRREGKDAEVKATLQSRDEGGGFRAEFQNRMGSELSNRRAGYSVILQHDSVLKPADCGSPLVDLTGRVVGLNISRAGRVETWAIPSEVIQPLLADLKSGRLAPKGK